MIPKDHYEAICRRIDANEVCRTVDGAGNVSLTEEARIWLVDALRALAAHAVKNPGFFASPDDVAKTLGFLVTHTDLVFPYADKVIAWLREGNDELHRSVFSQQERLLLLLLENLPALQKKEGTYAEAIDDFAEFLRRCRKALRQEWKRIRGGIR